MRLGLGNWQEKIDFGIWPAVRVVEANEADPTAWDDNTLSPLLKLKKRSRRLS